MSAKSYDELLRVAHEHAASGNHAKAMGYLQKFMDACREGEDDVGLGRAYRNIGVVYINMRKPKAALESLERGLAIARKTGNKKGEGKALMSMGVAYAALGLHDVATRYEAKAADGEEFIRGVGELGIEDGVREYSHVRFLFRMLIVISFRVFGLRVCCLVHLGNGHDNKAGEKRREKETMEGHLSGYHGKGLLSNSLRGGQEKKINCAIKEKNECYNEIW